MEKRYRVTLTEDGTRGPAEAGFHGQGGREEAGAGADSAAGGSGAAGRPSPIRRLPMPGVRSSDGRARSQAICRGGGRSDAPSQTHDTDL